MKMKHVIFSLLAISSAGCKPESPRSPPLKSVPEIPAKEMPNLQFTREMIAIVRLADKIILTEHSSQVDSVDSERGTSLIPIDIVYKTKTLTNEQSTFLVDLLLKADKEAGARQTADLKPFNTREVGVKPCLFSPHHSISFFLKKRELGQVSIDFDCGKAEWAGSGAEVPGPFISSFYEFWKRAGIEPYENWEKLADQYLKREQQKRSNR